MTEGNLKVLTITEEAFWKIVHAADSGSYSRRAITVLDEEHNPIARVVPGKMAWIVAEDAYEATVLNIAFDGTVSIVRREDV
jgi:hypothetical protein